MRLIVIYKAIQNSSFMTWAYELSLYNYGLEVGQHAHACILNDCPQLSPLKCPQLPPLKCPQLFFKTALEPLEI